MTKDESLAFISLERKLEWNRKKNLHLTVWLLSFTWMIFHFTVVFFFILKLESLVLVGIFLWLWNLFSFLLDVPVWILQYYLKSKTLYLIWAISQMIALLIFANFIFEATDFLAQSVVDNVWVFDSVLNFFLFDVVNILLLIIASFCYGLTKELNDITTISYILNNANPSQYKEIIAQDNLFIGIWSFAWLIVSWLILTFTPKLIIFTLLFIVIFIVFVINKLFDNSTYTFKFSDLEKFKVYFDKDWIWKAKEDLVKTVSKVDLGQALWKTKYIFLRPIVINKDMIWFSEMIEKTKESFINIIETLKYAKTTNLIVYWAFAMVLTFWFWDTFAATFLIEFLDKVKPWMSYILLWIIAIPAYALQWPFWKLADKIWVYIVTNIWLAISWLSLIFMSFFAWDLNLGVVMWLALLNSVWYAICMNLSVSTFLEMYNKSYAENKKLVEIDSNASATPMKILQNFANVVGLFLWWFVLALINYTWFFFVFGWLILWFLVWSIIKRKEIQA